MSPTLKTTRRPQKNQFPIDQVWVQDCQRLTWLVEAAMDQRAVFSKSNGFYPFFLNRWCCCLCKNHQMTQQQVCDATTCMYHQHIKSNFNLMYFWLKFANSNCFLVFESLDTKFDALTMHLWFSYCKKCIHDLAIAIKFLGRVEAQETPSQSPTSVVLSQCHKPTETRKGIGCNTSQSFKGYVDGPAYSLKSSCPGLHFS